MKDEYENIVTDGLVLNLDAGWYNSYPESGTVWTDLSGNNYDGTLTNGPSFSTNGQGSIAFDGVDDFVSGEAISSTAGSNSRTLCIWFRGSVNENTALWDKGSTGDGLADALFAAGSNGVGSSPPSNPGGIYVVFWNQDFYIPLGSSNVLDGDWHFVAYTYNSSNNTMTLCFDGTFPTTAYRWNNAWTTQTTQPFTMSFALNTPNSEYWLGRSRSSLWGIGSAFGEDSIGSVLQYNRVLSNSEILQNYNSLKYRFGYTAPFTQNGLVYYSDASNPASYPGTGTELYDLSNTSNNGDILNGVTFSTTFGGAFTFDGTDDRIELDSPSSLPVGTSDRTIIAFVKTPSTFSEPFLHVLHYGTPVQDQAFGLSIDQINTSSGYLATHPWVGSPYASSPTLSTSTVYGLAVGYQHSNTTHYFWINGTSVAGANNVRSINTGTNTSRIGARISDPTEDWGPSGEIYLVMVYNRLLSNSEITEIHNLFKGRYGL
jgi:hypothetical protein